MPARAWSEKAELDERVRNETRHLDLVASWETLCDIYDALRFHDAVSDAMRLEEFKWIIQETNKFLTRMRNGLAKAKDYRSAVEYLGNQFKSQEAKAINSRQSLAYNKLRQRWAMQLATQFSMRAEELEEEGEDLDG